MSETANLNSRLEEFAGAVADVINEVHAEVSAVKDQVAELAARPQAAIERGAAFTFTAVSVDDAQSFTPAQQAQALANLGLSAASFFVDQDLRAVFASKLVSPVHAVAAGAEWTPAPDGHLTLDA